MNFDGVHVPVVTPHREDGSIDRDAFGRVVEFLATEGVRSVIVGGSTGEGYAQTLDEREELARLARDALGGRAALVVGTGAIWQEDSVRMAAFAARIGADAILVSSPPYALPTERENALNALATDRAADLPIMLYNYPGRTGVHMGEEFLDRVGRSRNVQAIKESSGDISRVHLLARDYPHVPMLCGMDDQALEFFAWGAPGWVCGGGNFLPREHLALWRACRSPRAPSSTARSARPSRARPSGRRTPPRGRSWPASPPAGRRTWTSRCDGRATHSRTGAGRASIRAKGSAS